MMGSIWAILYNQLIENFQWTHYTNTEYSTSSPFTWHSLVAVIILDIHNVWPWVRQDFFLLSVIHLLIQYHWLIFVALTRILWWTNLQLASIIQYISESKHHVANCSRQILQLYIRVIISVGILYVHFRVEPCLFSRMPCTFEKITNSQVKISISSIKWI